ncbi:HNH endonuclease [Runella sp.]|jgi:5-methylcytosine-specific restriction endonuclease McrA|uniref:homing endonuclease associated repeat-containing protein n=1 Tax=Runella sp. TaxID=1960881 RepID=UPI002606D34F|nr:HNH endonuclease [Runella sp.]
MKFELNKYNRNSTEQDFLDDLRKVANLLKTDKLTQEEYQGKGKYSSSTVQKRFGRWNQVLEKAGLKVTLKFNVSERELFQNIEDVWIQLGRQPLYDEFKAPLSKYSVKPYERNFGTWRKALEAFIEFVESGDDRNQEIEENIPELTQEAELVFKHKTKRQPSERLKVQVLMRDGNKCRLCGVTVTGNSIHFDHIFPWSKGGETVLENLQVLCEIHNLAKGNLEYSAK